MSLCVHAKPLHIMDTSTVGGWLCVLRCEGGSNYILTCSMYCSCLRLGNLAKLGVHVFVSVDSGIATNMLIDVLMQILPLMP